MSEINDQIIETERKQLAEMVAAAIKESDEYITIGNVRVLEAESNIIHHQEIDGFHLIKIGTFNNPLIIIKYPFGFSLA